MSEDERDEGVSSTSEEQNPPQADNIRQKGNDKRDKPIYKGAPISFKESMLLILSLLVSYNLDQSCLSAIITVINLHCLKEEL